MRPDNRRGAWIRSKQAEKDEAPKKRLKRKDFLEYPKISYLIKHSASGFDPVEPEVLATLTKQTKIVVQEKIDGASVRICWDGEGAPLVGNRKHILNKGYVERDTPAKLQFRPLWNWIYDNKAKFAALSAEFAEPVIVYGEWLWAKHSRSYDALPDFFIAYDLLSEDLFKPVDLSLELLIKAGFETPAIIEVIDPASDATMEKLIALAVGPSAYGKEEREGIMVRGGTRLAKIVATSFVPRTDFNETDMVRNALK